MNKQNLIQQSPDMMGELMIWTDVAKENELDFNQWYDKEHMQERASIPGFQWSRRYHSETAARPYLALYRTDDLHVFKSAAYRQAFEHQTEWSVRNFSVMFNTKRRVNVVTDIAGAGMGAAVSLVCLGTVEQAQKALELAQQQYGELQGVISIRALTPNPELSTPLPSEDTSNRLIEPYLVIDTTTLSAAEQTGAWFAEQLKLGKDNHHTFRLLWDVRASEL